MDDEFVEYLNNAYWKYIQYGIEKHFHIFKDASNSDLLSIWEYDESVNVSDYFYYLIEKDTSIDGVIYEVPDLLYQTDDKEKSKKIIDALKIDDYEKKIIKLISIINKEKTLRLVDNKSYVKYN